MHEGPADTSCSKGDSNLILGTCLQNDNSQALERVTQKGCNLEYVWVKTIEQYPQRCPLDSLCSKQGVREKIFYCIFLSPKGFYVTYLRYLVFNIKGT